MPDDVVERRRDYPDIKTELALHGLRFEGVESAISGFGEDMKEVKNDISSLKVGQAKTDTKIDTLTTAVNKSLTANEKDRERRDKDEKRNTYTRWKINALCTAIFGTGGYLAWILPKGTVAKIIAFIWA